MGRLSVVSVLAGALSGLAAFEVLIVIAGAIGVAVNGGTNFATMSDAQFKAITGTILAAALFLAFMLGGYVSGRMSRRSGATHGVMAGVVGAILAALAGVAIVGTGTDTGLARVAHHINVADTWHQWRYVGILGIIVAAAAMILGALTGAVEGERWHGKLLARAVDPAYGPEALERAEARKRITEAETARLAAAGHVGRVTSTAKPAQADPRVTEPVAPVRADTPTETGPRTVPATSWAAASSSTGRTTRAMPVASDQPAAPADTGSRPKSGRSRHLLGGRK